jgi:hypothetical protein
MRHLPALALALTVMSFPAMAADPVATGGALTAAPAEWLGPAPHLVMMGQAAGQSLDIQLTDMAAAAGIEGFEGKREYLPGDGAALRYGDFEVALKALIGGLERSIELEFENADFATHPLPATFTLQDREFPEGLLSNLEVQLEWEGPEGAVNAESAGWTGTLTLLHDEGTKDGSGASGDGWIGGFVLAEKDGERLVISFTVPVVEYEIDG